MEQLQLDFNIVLLGIAYEAVFIQEWVYLVIPDPEKFTEQALEYRDCGWNAVPVGPDKATLVEWKGYQSRLATEDEIRGWWQAFPDAQIAILTGALSNIVVVDVEHGGNFEGFPDTPTAKTGGGGRHYYFKHPGKPVKSMTRIRELTDIKGDGGCVVAPPSRSYKGLYEWIKAPGEVEFAPLPEWVLAEQKKTPEGGGHVEQDWEAIFSSEVLEGMRNDTAIKVAGKMLNAMPPETWPIGWELFRTWNKSHVTPPLEEKDLKKTWKSIEKAEKLSRKEKADQETKLPPRSRIATCPAPSSPTTFEQWRDVIKDNFPDLLFASEVALSVVAQFLIKDITNPFALVLVDVPSSGKTICINFFDNIPELSYATDKFTPASFVSNSANVPKEKLGEIDLLPRIQYRMFLIRDFATLFSKREEDLNELLGILTRVLDGEGLNTDSGVHGQRQYNGEYLFMMLAASTPIAPRVMKVMGNLGSRIFFLGINSKDKSESELAEQITDTSYKEKEGFCRIATKNFLYGLWNAHPQGIVWDRKADDKELLAIIARCSKLLASLRGVINVWDNNFNDEFKYATPVIEKPDRLNQLFYNLTRCHALVSGRTQITKEDLIAVIELCIDGAPSGRAGLFRKLLEHGGAMSTSQVQHEMNCSKPTALKEMKTLEILKVCSLHEQTGRDNEIWLTEEFTWFLGNECRQIRDGVKGDKANPPLCEENKIDSVNETVESGSQPSTIPAIGQIKTPYKYITRADELRGVLPTLVSSKIVALDTETTGLYPLTDKMRLIQLATENEVVIVDLNHVDVKEIQPLLDSNATIIGHNLKFDLKFLMQAGITFGDKITFFDTQLADQILRGSGVYRSLEAVAKEYLGVILDKTYQKARWGEALTPEMLAYAAKDAAILLPLLDRTCILLAEQSLLEVIALENEALPFMAQLELTGVPIQSKAWRALTEGAKAECDRLEVELNQIAGKVVNWRSPQQITAVLKEQGLVVESTSEAALRPHSGHILVGTLLKYREQSKYLSTYGEEFLEHINKVTRRIHPSFHQIGADSGRMSCSDPNMQNIPRNREYRACIAPREGRVLVKADYSQIELRIAAEISGDKRLIEAYKAGSDIHSLTAQLIIGKENPTKEDRQAAKAINFGLLYGMGAPRLKEYARNTYGVELTDDEALRFKRKFFDTYQGLRSWHRSQTDGVETTKTLSGRKRFNVERFTEKLNTPVQGTGADGLKAAFSILWKERAKFPTAQPVLVVHDEVIVECDLADAELVADWLKGSMIRGMGRFVKTVPVEVEVTVSPTWAK